LFQDLIYSVVSIVSIFKRLRRFVTVNLAEEKSLSEDVAMAGIDSISRAIFDKFGKSPLQNFELLELGPVSCYET
jgi:hypothetical protein